MAPDHRALFLLEHNYGQATGADLARMHRALTLAVIRLTQAGRSLRIVSAVFVPDQARCLYLVEAPVAGQVVEATDIAGLSNGTVQPVVRLDDMPPPRRDPTGAGRPHNDRKGKPMQILERWAWRLTWLLPVWGAVTIPATLTQQPDASTDFAAYADYVTTTRFLVGHLVGSIAATVLGILGIVGLAVILARTRAARSALTAATVAIVGCGLLLPVFGVAAFAQPAIGNAAHAGLAGAQQIDSDIYGPLTIAVGGTAALAFTVGLAWLGVVVVRSRQLPRWSGWLLAVAGLFIGVGGLLVGLLQPIGGLCLLVGGLGIAWLGPRINAAAAAPAQQAGSDSVPESANHPGRSDRL